MQKREIVRSDIKFKNIKLKDIKRNKYRNKKKEKKKSVWKIILIIFLSLFIAGITACAAFALYIVTSAPEFDTTALYQKQPTILYDKYGNELVRVGYRDSEMVSYDDIPDVLIDALVATEDSRFFEHNGMDIPRFIKAVSGHLAGKKDAGGASTLSMQVIKNTYTSSEDQGLKGIIRKFTDIYMAVFKLEKHYTKEQIIEFYLNSQWFANAGDINIGSGIYGVEKASQHFFGKSVKELNLAESSLLVGMFQNTVAYNPYNYPEKARARQKVVLNLMIRHGYITEKERDEILAIPIEDMLAERNTVMLAVGSNQAFIDYVLAEVQKELGIDPRATSLKIYTTFDPEIQKILEKIEDGEIYQYPDESAEEGIAITSTEDGSVVALSGGRNYVARGYNFATDIRRQPGSTAKPIFDYAMYIEHISKSTYAMFLDEKTTYSNGDVITNYDNGYKGLITMRYALTDSRNIPALRAFKAVAAKDKSIIEDFVHSVGINYGPDLYESSSIGGMECASPLTISAAYAAFGRGGYYIAPYGYTKVINNETGEEINHEYEKVKVMEESTAFMINDILEGVVSGTGIAGKTGTTNLNSDTKKRYGLPSGALMDVWYATYSPSYSIALWYGYKEIEPDAAATKHYLTSAIGGTARRTIMNHLVSTVHKKGQSFTTPNTVVRVNVEKETFPAQLCSSYTPSSMCISEYFVKGSEPTTTSTRYSQLNNPTNGSYTVNNGVVTLKWNEIETPDAINPTYLTAHFNEHYAEYADTYYANRLAYNSSSIGSLGYQVYLKNSSGYELYLGHTTGNAFVYTVSSGKTNSSISNYTFVVKSAYSIFTDNRSTGLTIPVRVVYNYESKNDSDIDDI